MKTPQFQRSYYELDLVFDMNLSQVDGAFGCSHLLQHLISVQLSHLNKLSVSPHLLLSLSIYSLHISSRQGNIPHGIEVLISTSIMFQRRAG